MEYMLICEKLKIEIRIWNKGNRVILLAERV